MYIAIPVDNENLEEAKITTTIDAKTWAIINFDAGEVKSTHTAPSWQESGVDWLDFVVLENRFENIIDFLNEGIMVLCRREGQESIESIMEAFKFKELDEVGL
jgi:predicted Fe-Mo cluster-binding NifX family protein